MLSFTSKIRFFPNLTIVNAKGEKILIEFNETQTLYNAVEGTKAEEIRGTCGGNKSCGQCHVELPPNLYSKPDEEEADLLESCDGVTKYSRLACQLVLGPKFEDAVIKCNH